MTKEVKELIEKHIAEIEKDNFVNVIAEAAKKGVDYVIELRNVIKGADIKTFDEQFAKILIGYGEIVNSVSKAVEQLKSVEKFIK